MSIIKSLFKYISQKRLQSFVLVLIITSLFVFVGCSDPFEGYTLIEVEGGDQSGHRESNVVVDIGFGDREYYAFTNEYGQLIKVTAKKIILQDDSTEDVLSTG